MIPALLSSRGSFEAAARRSLNLLLDIIWRGLRFRLQRRAPTAKETPLAIMVHSFDGYKRFWGPARYFTERAIPSGVPIYYVTENIPMHDNPSKTILTGKGGFSTRLMRGLTTISRRHRYVLYLQEDIWLEDPLPEAMLLELVRTMDVHSLDCLKLGWASFQPKDYPDIVQTTELLPRSNEFRWFGAHDYAMSHHCSIFRSNFFWCTALVAKIFRREHPLAHERLISMLLIRRSKSKNDDEKDVRIAVWNQKPKVPYTHASFEGILTDDGRRLLDLHKVGHLFDENLEGEVFPSATRGGLRQIQR